MCEGRKALPWMSGRYLGEVLERGMVLSGGGISLGRGCMGGGRRVSPSSWKKVGCRTGREEWYGRRPEVDWVHTTQAFVVTSETLNISLGATGSH